MLENQKVNYVIHILLKLMLKGIHLLKNSLYMKENVKVCFLTILMYQTIADKYYFFLIQSFIKIRLNLDVFLILQLELT